MIRRIPVLPTGTESAAETSLSREISVRAALTHQMRLAYSISHPITPPVPADE